MAIALGDNIGITGPLPNDNRYYNTSTNKPWTSEAEVNAALTGGVGGLRFTGLTVNIGGTEYWYKEGITDPDLIEKESGGGITGATNGLCKYDSENVCLGGTISDNTLLYVNFGKTLNTCGTFIYNVHGFSNISITGITGHFYGSAASAFGVLSGGTCSNIYFSCNDMVVTDEFNSSGMSYNADYSTIGALNPRWIPDAEWVTGNTGVGNVNWNGSTANALGTYVDADTICAEPNLNFNGSLLAVTGSSVIGDVCSTATGTYVLAHGCDVTACGDASHAEGRGTIASGTTSHAEGWNSVAVANCSHAEGNDTRSCGAFAHAEGVATHACGYGSHAEGFCTCALGIESHAEGWCTAACGNYAHATGFFNIGCTSTIAEIGVGANVLNKCNAFEVFCTGAVAFPELTGGAGCLVGIGATGLISVCSPPAASGTDLSIGSSTGTVVRIDSSTGTNATLPLASATLAGVVSNTTQTFAGIKTTSTWCATTALKSTYLCNLSYIRAGTTTETAMYILANSCVQLYFNNLARLKTITDGICVYGNNIYTDDKLIFDTSATGKYICQPAGGTPAIMRIVAGSSTDSSLGGGLVLCAGNNTSTGSGGSVCIYAGCAGSTTNDGSVYIRANSATSGGIIYCGLGGVGSSYVALYQGSTRRFQTTSYGTLTEGCMCASTCVKTPYICTAAIYGATCINLCGGSNIGMRVYGTNNYLLYNGGTELYTHSGGICVPAKGYALDWIATSDCRLKTCIIPISDALSKVDCLCGRCYEWCKDGCPDMGLIAQEVEKVEPMLVTYSDNEHELSEDDDNELETNLGLKYDKFAGLFVEAIKELKQQNECLQKQINELK